MGRELWAERSAAMSVVDRRVFDNPDFEHSTSVIVRCCFWSCIHNNATSWAAEPSNWDRMLRPKPLPSQSTLSRRLRSREFEEFMRLLESHLSHLPNAGTLFKRLDGKPLPVAAHSTDRDARWGRGAARVRIRRRKCSKRK